MAGERLRAPTPLGRRLVNHYCGVVRCTTLNSDAMLLVKGMVNDLTAKQRVKMPKRTRASKVRFPTPRRLKVVKTIPPKTIGSSLVTGKPTVVSGPRGRVRVRNSNYVCQIVGRAGFTLEADLLLNPGLPQFGWISRLAALYEKYRVVNLSFKFIPCISTGANGQTMMAIETDPKDDPPDSVAMMSAYEGCSTKSVWLENNVSIASTDWKICRTGYNSDVNVRVTDVGRILVATTAVTGDYQDAQVGDLYVTYDLEFKTPQLNLSGVSPVLAQNPDLGSPLGDGLTQKENTSMPIRYLSPTIATATQSFEGMLTAMADGTYPSITVASQTAAVTLIKDMVDAASDVASYALKMKRGDVLTFDTPSGTALTALALYFAAGSYNKLV